MASVGKRVLDSARVVNATVSSDAIALENPFFEFVAYLKAEATAGGTSIAVSIEHSPNGVDWFTVGSFTAVAGNGVQELQITKWMFPQVRAHYVRTSGNSTLTCELYFRSQR